MAPTGNPTGSPAGSPAGNPTGIPAGIQQGFQQGIQQGIQQGVQQGARLKEGQIIRQLLNRGSFSPEEIASLVNVDIARVREIAEEDGKEV